MTFTELSNYLRQHLSGARLELDNAQETNKAFLPLLIQCYIKGFAIDSCKLTEEGNEIIATGSCGLPPLYNGKPLAAVMRFWVERTGEIGYQLELSCNATVSLGNFFGRLQPGYGVVDGFYTNMKSPLANMLLQRPRLTMRSQDSGTELPFVLESGLSFPPNLASWQSYSPWLPFITRITGGVSLISTSLYGEGARFVLKIPLNGAGLGFAFPSALEQGEIALHINSEEPSPSVSAENEYVTRVDIICSAKLQGVQTPIVVSAPLFGAEDVFYFTANFEDGLSLPDIARTVLSLLGMPGKAEQLRLPDSSPLENLRLYDFDMAFWKGAASDVALRQIKVTMGTAHQWQLPLPSLTLRNLLVKWSIIWGEDRKNNAFSVTLRGLIAIKLFGERSLLLYATTTLPEMTLEAHLSLMKSTQKAALGEIIGDAPVKSLNCGNAELSLAELDLVASPTKRTLYLHASVRDLLSWRVGKINFVLAEVSATANFTQAKNTFSLSGCFSVDAQGSPFSFTLSGSYNGTGWIFAGTLNDGSVRLGGLLLGLLGISYTASQADFLLTAFNIGYNTATGVLNLEAAFEDDWGLSIGKLPVQLGGCIAVRSGESEKTYVAALLFMQLGVFRLSVQADDFFGEMPTYIFQIALGESILRAIYSAEQIEGVKHEIVSVQLVNITLGDIVTALIVMINPNHSYRLPAPWNLLNKIDLSRFRLRYDLTTESLSISYNLSLRIPALLEIRSVGLVYAKQEDGSYSLRFSVEGTTLATGEPLNVGWDALKGAPPAAVGNDNRFELHYLGMGQHFGTPSLLAATTVSEAVNAMKESFTLENASFSSEVEWLLGVDFAVNNMISVQLAFNDPLLYGAIIEVMKGNTPLSVFAGLRLELLYRKISKDVGMFKVTLRMPDRYRRLQLGAFTFTIGMLGLEIYTNGDFLLDLGFPYGTDFTRSFSLEAGIYCGHGGLYFGVLSGATAANLPVTSRGRFNTVLALGVGLSIGIGRSFDFGIVKAGLSLEVLGIFEGLFAVFEPNSGGDSQIYYSVQATVGIIGRLFISVDLKIITIQASVTISAYASVTLIACKPMLLELDVSLTMKAYIKILFIKINFSFTFSRHFSFSIGSASPAPWDSLRQRSYPMLEGEPFEAAYLGKLYTARLRIVPVFSLEEGGVSYCAAFVPVMDKDGFVQLMAMLAEWTLRQWSEVVDRESAETLTVEQMRRIVDYKRLCDFLELNFKLSLTADSLLRAQQNADFDGVVIAMPPPISLLFAEDATGAEPWFEVDYSAATPVSSAYADSIHSYFEKLNPNPNGEPYFFAEPSDPVPLAQVVFVDYLHMLLRELIGKLHSLFLELTLDAAQLPSCEKLCGVAPADALEQNLGLELREGDLALENLQVMVNEGDTVKQMAQHCNIKITEAAVALAEVRQLLLGGAAFETRQFNLDNKTRLMTVAQGAAYSFVRFREFALQSHYQKTARQLQELNDGITLDWEETQDGGTTLLLIDNRRWPAMPGDTVERLAKMLALENLALGELQEWDSYRAAFVTANGGDATAVLQRLTIPATNVWVEGDVSLAALFRRLYPQGEDFASEQNPLLSLPLLRPTALLTLPYCCSVAEGETVGKVMERTGLNAQAIAQGLLKRPEMIKQPQSPLVIRNAPFVAKTLAIGLLTDSGAFDTLGAMSSRFLLQGLRLPSPNGEGDTEPFYRLMGQQTGLPETPKDWLLKLWPANDCTWIEGRAEDSLPWQLIEPELPDREFNWTPYVLKNEPLAVGCAITKSFTATSTLVLMAREGNKRLHMLSDELTACIDKTGGLRLLNDPGVTVETAALFPFTLLRTGEEGSFAVEGMEVSKRHGLYSLWQLAAQKEIAYDICYSPNPLQLEGVLYRGEWDASKSVFVRSNLSLETHRTPVTRANERRVDISIPGTPDFLLMLWQCSVVGGGGHLLRLQTAQGGSLPADIFDDDGRATLWLLACDSDGRLTEKGIANTAVTECRVADGNGDRADFVPIDPQYPALLASRPTLPAGCVGTALELRRPEEDDTPINRTRRLFSIFSYSPKGAAYPGIDVESAPMQPCGSSENDLVWRYEAVFPAWKLVALPNGAGRCAYSALGKEPPKLVFGCRDILGNRADGQLECGNAVPYYNDELIGIGQWPCTSAGYTVIPGDGGAVMALRMETQKREELEHPDAAAAVVRASIAQMEQDDLVIILHTTLCDAVWAVDKETLLDYARGLVRYMEDGGSAPLYEQSHAFPAYKQAAEPYPLTTQLELRREKHLAPDSPKAFISVATELNPGTEAAAFAAKLETAFPQVKLAWAGGEGGRLTVVTTGEGGMLQRMSVYPYKRKALGNTDVSAPYYWGLHPLANKRMSATVPLDGILLAGWLGEEKERVYTGVDMDEWARRLLRDFEELLASKEMERAALQAADAAKRLVMAKEALAKAICRQLVPIEAGLRPESQEAKELLLDELRRALSNGDRFATVAQYCLETKAECHYRMPVSLCGKDGSTQLQSGLRVRAGKLDSTASSFCLIYSSDDLARSGFAPEWEPMVSELEYNIQAREGGYEQSDWLQFIIPLRNGTPLLDIRSESDLGVPNPLRSCPSNPALTGHSCLFNQDKLYQWEYRLVCEAELPEQDMFVADVAFSVRQHLKRNAQQDLFVLLCCYDVIRDSLLERLRSADDKVFDDAVVSYADFLDKLVVAWASLPDCALQRQVAENNCHAEMQVVFDKQQAELKVKCERPGVYADFADGDNPLPGQRAAFMLHIPQISVYEYNMAQPQLYTRRNSNLLRRRDGGYSEVDERFIYRSEQVGLPSVYAGMEVTGEILFFTTAEQPGNSTFLNAAEKLLKDLGLAGQSVDASFAVSCAYSLDPDGLPARIELPLALFPPTGLLTAKFLADGITERFVESAPSTQDFSLYFNVAISPKDKTELLLAFTRLRADFGGESNRR